eukprot:g16060.t1
MDFAVCFPTIAEDLKGLVAWKEEVTASLTQKDEAIAQLQTEVDSSKEEITKLQEEITALRGDPACTDTVHSLDGRIKELEGFDVDTLRKDFDVRWAEVKPELEKVIEFAPKIDAQDLKISESEAKAQVAKQKCEDFEVRITKIDNEWTAYQKDERKLQDVITKFDDGIKRVEGVLFIFGLHSFGSKTTSSWADTPPALLPGWARRSTAVEIVVFAGRCDEGWVRLWPTFPPPGFESPLVLICQLGLSWVEVLAPPSRFRGGPPSHLFLL